MNIEVYYAFTAGLAYAYIGLMVLLMAMESADRAIELWVEDSLFKSVFLLLTWPVSITCLLCIAWFKKWQISSGH